MGGAWWWKPLSRIIILVLQKNKQVFWEGIPRLWGWLKLIPLNREQIENLFASRSAHWCSAIKEDNFSLSLSARLSIWRSCFSLSAFKLSFVKKPHPFRAPFSNTFPFARPKLHSSNLVLSIHSVLLPRTSYAWNKRQRTPPGTVMPKFDCVGKTVLTGIQFTV